MIDTLLEKIRAIVGDEHVVSGEVVRAEPPAWDTHQPCNARALVRPGDTGEVAAVLAACHAAGQGVVTYGGVTNLVQACATTPDDLVLSLERIAAVEELDATAQTLTAGAGLTLAEAQRAAEAEGLLYPVDIGARDNCTLGGNVATNAGGTRVIRYGMTRDSVLGLEAVLADGTVLSSMNRYIKNNSGYDLKQLFVGSEGTLGIITRVVMRLDVQPASHNVALLACRCYDDVVAVLSQLRAALGANLTGFEVMWNSFYGRVVAPEGRQPAPVPAGHACYVVVEAMGANEDGDDAAFAAALEAVFDSGAVEDGVVAKSAKEREAIWAIRHDVEWIVTGARNFDVSLRIADIGEYVERLEETIGRALPDAHVAAFGHLGDNNLHVSVLAPDGAGETVERAVYEQLVPYAGAISAEHGIGLDKRRWLKLSRTPEEIATMRTLKRTLDPRNVLNPGKVVGKTGGQAA